MLKREYSKDVAILLALISHMSVGKKSQRTPRGLAKDLSIPEDEITSILRKYKSLFREASKPKKGGDQKPFSLHLRYALQYEVDEDESTVKPPLPSEHVTALIDLVTGFANAEKGWNIHLIVSLVAAGVAVIAALIAAFGGGVELVCGAGS